MVEKDNASEGAASKSEVDKSRVIIPTFGPEAPEPLNGKQKILLTS